ncbi:hypothetical protein BKG91_01900 [Rodentibacter caecimuris]|uniref:DUF1425 domain-containing protein n=1 Tax=Rodentibacter caecimuris TaxID=1796644 RepID=A0AAJ3K6G3_9PAST|nr:DUF1425 domain-containing protein [Rodentibacter heylii]AOF52484.1 putative periplasmic lipoprotein [Pasteurellaceae bacterium NI1060]MCQ9123221.1 DUF1425 domain-containing protein [Rodentibacter heylii]OOF73555.1 hypothetical protein BKG90_00450 [Rodentibacter heylii]OOF75877.1 hypothetical protein BKG91_01900 [Rodentibacter heylii]OOF76759.1 hypothetical protein BKG99_05505 [Rodentibacter heylii]
MKKLLIIFAGLVLSACSVSGPNLVHTNTPILNITAELASVVEANVSADSAWVKNKTSQPVNVNYHLFWYNAQGVTQVWADQRESVVGNLRLQPQARQSVELIKPTLESTNYRLYLQ